MRQESDGENYAEISLFQGNGKPRVGDWNDHDPKNPPIIKVLFWLRIGRRAVARLSDYKKWNKKFYW